MELVSPITLLSTYLASPTSENHQPPPLVHPSTLLVGLWVMHYFNRAIISPLRTPSRSPSHITIPLAAAAFNLLNAGLNGSWLSSGVVKHDGWNNLGFWASIGLFVAGWIGNIVHDEILINIRKESKAGGQDGKPKYGIPHGYLYRFVSFPNYLCEWTEWTGFALAASIASGWATPIYQSPPWLFVLNEVATMLPRALSGHQWYHEKFSDYPKDRKAVIPLLL
ncbi:hypothetical protein FS837_004023 [Tulasnella sp. UAMH 9824]|nr:hypothetical protein FS837_004023 [Tulasnella sp. UAMH 9824]